MARGKNKLSAMQIKKAALGVYQDGAGQSLKKQTPVAGGISTIPSLAVAEIWVGKLG